MDIFNSISNEDLDILIGILAEEYSDRIEEVKQAKLVEDKIEGSVSLIPHSNLRILMEQPHSSMGGYYINPTTIVRVLANIIPDVIQTEGELANLKYKLRGV